MKPPIMCRLITYIQKEIKNCNITNIIITKYNNTQINDVNQIALDGMLKGKTLRHMLAVQSLQWVYINLDYGPFRRWTWLATRCVASQAQVLSTRPRTSTS